MINDLMIAAFKSDEDLRKALLRIIKEELGMSVSDFSKESGIPLSTLYKIISGDREPNLKTLRTVSDAIKKSKGEEGKFIAVIAARPTLDRIERRVMRITDKPITIKEYPATTIEDAIVASIRAERDGAFAVVCAPIVSPTLEKILHIPITTVVPKTSLEGAIELAVKKYL
ncbi:MAG: helix-turn-helix domain-containing protein [Halobacteriota archaeon]|nr:helix-turn-helix domain-containing protein [Halobacteriota archaeon]